jgi:hypothetical protein
MICSFAPLWPTLGFVLPAQTLGPLSLFLFFFPLLLGALFTGVCQCFITIIYLFDAPLSKALLNWGDWFIHHQRDTPKHNGISLRLCLFRGSNNIPEWGPYFSLILKFPPILNLWYLEITTNYHQLQQKFVDRKFSSHLYMPMHLCNFFFFCFFCFFFSNFGFLQ